MSITVIDNLLTSAEILEYRAFVDSCRHFTQAPILSNKEAVVENFWMRYGERLRREAGIQRITNFVTVSRSDRALGWHYDESKDGDTHKILIYLDDVAGTLFRMGDGGGIREIAAVPGRAVIFDFRLEHAGAPIPPGRGGKYTVGFRGCGSVRN
jgi:hypothetical protein